MILICRPSNGQSPYKLTAGIFYQHTVIIYRSVSLFTHSYHALKSSRSSKQCSVSKPLLLDTDTIILFLATSACMLIEIGGKSSSSTCFNTFGSGGSNTSYRPTKILQPRSGLACNNHQKQKVATCSLCDSFCQARTVRPRVF